MLEDSWLDIKARTAKKQKEISSFFLHLVVKSCFLSQALATFFYETAVGLVNFRYENHRALSTESL